MKTYYCVITTISNRGRVTAHLSVSIEADQRPESTHISTWKKDYWTDWFDDKESAQLFVREARKA